MTKEAENLCEEMVLNMIWKSEMIIILIRMMVVVRIALLKEVMYEMEELSQATILAHFALLKVNLQTMTKILVLLNEEIG